MVSYLLCSDIFTTISLLGFFFFFFCFSRHSFFLSIFSIFYFLVQLICYPANIFSPYICISSPSYTSFSSSIFRSFSMAPYILHLMHLQSYLWDSTPPSLFNATKKLHSSFAFILLCLVVSKHIYLATFIYLSQLSGFF